MGRKLLYPKICIADGCDKKSTYHGMCNSHAYAWQKENIVPKTCIVDGCEKEARYRGMCNSHGYAWRKQHSMEFNVAYKCCKNCYIPTRSKDGYCSPVCRDYDKLPRCKTCGKVIFSFLETRAYCSRECYDNREKEEKPKGICEQCGKDFVRDVIRGEGNDALRFCSRECSWKSQKKDIEPKSCKVYFPECNQCAELFTTRIATRKCCSRKCDAKYRYSLDPDYYKSMSRKNHIESRKRKGIFEKTYTCIVCQEHFLSFKFKKCCSIKCSKKHAKEMHKASNKARDKRINGRCVDKNITLKRLHKKDGGMCGICGKKVDMRHKHPHPMSGSIDHILPLALGGWHEWTNVQLAHFSCNSSKGATMPKQRRIGLFESLRG